MYRAPKQLPPLPLLLSDLPESHPRHVAKLLGVSERTIWAYKAAEQAPRAIMLALFWESSLQDTAAGVLALYERHKALAPVAAIVGKSLPWVSKHLSVATKLAYHASGMLRHGITEDMDLLLTINQIESLPNYYPRLNNLIDKIEQEKAGRKEAR